MLIVLRMNVTMATSTVLCLGYKIGLVFKALSGANVISCPIYPWAFVYFLHYGFTDLHKAQRIYHDFPMMHYFQ